MTGNLTSKEAGAPSAATSADELLLEGGKHAVLLLHGMGANVLEVTRIAQSLHAGGLSIFAPTIRGFCHGMPCSDWKDWVEQGHLHLHALRERYQTVSIVGLSMGATLGLALAEENPVDALVLLAPALAYDGWTMPWYNFLLYVLPIVPFKQFWRYREAHPYGVKNPEMRAMIKKALGSDRVSELGGESISLPHITQGLRMIKHVKRNIEQVTSPALLMHAVEDDTVCIKNAEWVHDHIASKRKDMIYLGDSYHMITIDNERDTVFQETERFIKLSINDMLPSPAFEMPPLALRELRRLLKAGS